MELFDWGSLSNEYPLQDYFYRHNPNNPEKTNEIFQYPSLVDYLCQDWGDDTGNQTSQCFHPNTRSMNGRFELHQHSMFLHAGKSTSIKLNFQTKA